MCTSYLIVIETKIFFVIYLVMLSASRLHIINGIWMSIWIHGTGRMTVRGYSQSTRGETVQSYFVHRTSIIDYPRIWCGHPLWEDGSHLSVLCHENMPDCLHICIRQIEWDGTCAKTRFHLSMKRISPWNGLAHVEYIGQALQWPLHLGCFWSFVRPFFWTFSNLSILLMEMSVKSPAFQKWWPRCLNHYTASASQSRKHVRPFQVCSHVTPRTV